MKYKVTVGGRSYSVEIDHDRLVWIDGRPLYVELEQVGGLPVYNLTLDDAGYVLFIEEGQAEYRVEVRGQIYPVEIQPQRPDLALHRVTYPCGEKQCLSIRAPLAGHLASLSVTVGDRVQAGQVIAVLESMKMQIELRAPGAGKVEAVYGPAERDVRQGDELVILQTG
jgi:biotin carboxyl carrier protein